jgi:hypothetical protein
MPGEARLMIFAKLNQQFVMVCRGEASLALGTAQAMPLQLPYQSLKIISRQRDFQEPKPAMMSSKSPGCS